MTFITKEKERAKGIALLDEAMARIPERFKGKPNRYLTGSIDRIKKFILDYDKTYFESFYPGAYEHIL